MSISTPITVTGVENAFASDPRLTISIHEAGRWLGPARSKQRAGAARYQAILN